MITRRRAEQILKNISGKRIIVAGDIMLDRYLWGKVDRISPEAPVPVVKIERETEIPGGAANVAVNTASLGAETECLSLCGTDDRGERIICLLSEAGVGTGSIIRDPDISTISKTRVIAHEQHIVRVDREKTDPPKNDTDNSLIEKLKKISKGADAVILSDYGKGTLSPSILKESASLKKDKGIFTALDPKERNFSRYCGFSICTPNSKETREAVGYSIENDRALLKAGPELIKKFGLDSILITLGSRGMALFEGNNPPSIFKACAREIFDVTGAGDTVISVLTAAVTGGASLPEAAEIANIAAGIAVSGVGTVTISPKQIIDSIK
ncbi:MAG: D-glycero-beta-D-manno-heptose-7-phosphate kinase [Fibrobacterota bacterium]